LTPWKNIVMNKNGMRGYTAGFEVGMTRLLEVFRRYAGKRAFIAFFILCALPNGLMMALLTPPGEVPDEPAHMDRAAGLLHGVILAGRKSYIDPNTQKLAWQAGFKEDAGLAQAAGGQETMIGNLPVYTAADFLAVRAIPSDHRKVFVHMANTVKFFPAAYVPAALGLALGLAVNAPPYVCFYLGRLFMLAAFLALGVLALGLTEYGEAALLSVLILPSTLLLAGSMNQDGVLIAVACLACAALTRGTRRMRLLSIVLAVLLVGAKLPYIFLLGVFVLPLSSPDFWRRVRDAALACAPVLVWVALVGLFVAVPFNRAPYHPGPLYSGDPNVLFDRTSVSANLHILLAQPSRFITLPWSTSVAQGPVILAGLAGVLSSFEVSFPATYDWLWCGCLAVAFAGLAFSPRLVAPAPRAAWVNFLFVSFLLLASYWLILIGEYLDWTNVGMDFISGMQSRYLLPMLPFLLFAIPQLRCRFKLHPFVPAIPSILLGIADLGYLPVKLVLGYYLH